MTLIDINTAIIVDKHDKEYIYSLYYDVALSGIADLDVVIGLLDFTPHKESLILFC